MDGYSYLTFDQRRKIEALPSFGFTADIKRKGVIQYVYKEKDVWRLRIPRKAYKRSNLRCRGTARIYGRADKIADAV